MRRISIVLFLSTLVLGLIGPAVAQVTALDAATQALRSSSVYVDGAAEAAKDVDVDRLRARVRRGDSAIFVAVLPAAARNETGGDPGALPTALGNRIRVAGTYVVLSGDSLNAASSVLPSGRAQALAAAASRSGGPVSAKIESLIDSVHQEAGPQASRGGGGGAGAGAGTGDEGGGAGGGGAVLLLLAIGGGGLFMWSRSRRKKQRAADQQEFAADRQMLQADLSVLGDDVLALEPEVTLHPDARADYDAGVTRFKSAQAALEYADDQVDLVRVGRVIEEGRYAMSRARAIVQGRPPPPPPAELTRPGRHDEPAMELDEEGAPRYSGYGGMPFYGGGWFGGGGGLLTGLMLGQMFGGGWGGGWHGGGHGHDEGGEPDGGGDGGGGDGGDWGGGDFGGGDFGGGDFGGGDFGGGDF